MRPEHRSCFLPSETIGRYMILALLGEGGMGTVLRVHDPDLGRTVALKILRVGVGAGAVERFASEARLTARLQHPAIVPVHEAGALPDGRLYYTMPEIPGSTLEALIQARSTQSDPPEEDLERLVEALRGVALAVEHAHGRGVLHRDLKPSNVLLADDDAVSVLDWGLARLFEEDGPGTPSSVGGDPRTTRAAGTLAWMSPEQARGEDLGRTSDVYALGAVLWTVLAGRPPGEGVPLGERIEHARRGGMPDLPCAAPPELELACWRAMRPAPDERFPSARSFAEALDEWLSARRQRRAGLAHVRVAARHSERALALRSEEADFRRRAMDRYGGLAPYAPEAEKVEAWSLEDRARDAELGARAEELRAESELLLALRACDTLEEARAGLAAAARLRMERAETEGASLEATRLESLLREHDRGEHADWLEGAAWLSLETSPPGAVVTAHPVAEVGRRRVPSEPIPLGRTPVQRARLSHGSWLLRAEAPEHAVLTVPILLRRAEHFDGIAPGASAPSVIRLSRDGELGDGERLVVAGWCVIGGDPEAGDALSRRRVWVDGFVIQRSPVTWAAYRAFLDDLVERGADEVAARHCPRGPTAGSPLVRGPDGRFVPTVDASGRGFAPDWPVSLVSWEDAMAYAAWWSSRTGLPWRLPHELEWEKAARGADGRAFPWGDFFDPSRARCALSAPGAPTPVSVDAHPVDESPFGVRGMAGNVRDLCLNPWRRSGHPEDGERLTVELAEPGELRVVRGGSWNSQPHHCRAAMRVALGTAERLRTVGFRLARPAGSA